MTFKQHALLENQYYTTANYANMRQRLEANPDRCMKCGVNMATDIHIAKHGVIALCRECHREEDRKLENEQEA